MTAAELAELIRKADALEADLETWKKMYFDKVAELKKMEDDKF